MDKFYGIYRAVCMDNADPIDKNRIKVQVPQVLGQSISDWAWPCLPVLSNANHPDHKKHLASEVAALLNAHADHAISGTTGGTTVSTFGSHTHTFSYTAAHTNNHTGKSPDTTWNLDHAHDTDPDEENKWNDNLEITTEFPEHTPHRLVPDLNQGVWVMFEGGDPNFPIWMGVF
jgi:hypothetical protein